MIIKGLNHLAFITDDMTKTIRFYRDLLGIELAAGIGHDGYRHYFFQMAGNQTSGPRDGGQIAFFEYEGAKPMKRDKFHGSPTSEPRGFDLVGLPGAARHPGHRGRRAAGGGGRGRRPAARSLARRHRGDAARGHDRQAGQRPCHAPKLPRTRPRPDQARPAAGR